MKLLRAIAWALVTIAGFVLAVAMLPFVHAADWLAEGLQ